MCLHILTPVCVSTFDMRIKRRGFSLHELLIVIAIIPILATIATVPAGRGNLMLAQRPRQGKHQDTIHEAELRYNSELDALPRTLANWASGKTVRSDRLQPDSAQTTGRGQIQWVRLHDRQHADRILDHSRPGSVRENRQQVIFLRRIPGHPRQVIQPNCATVASAEVR